VYIFCGSGLASCRWRQLTSNVRPHVPTLTYLQCTRAVLDGFGLNPADLQSAPNAVSRLGNWTLNRVPIADRMAYLFMSDRTYLNFPILEGKNKVELQDMPAFLQHGLHQILSGIGASPQQIQAAVADLDEIAVTRATSRSSQAMHAAIVVDYAHVLRGLGGLGTHNLSRAINEVNDLPRRKLQWATSVEATLELLASGAA
jgi:hypothetical protein